MTIFTNWYTQVSTLIFYCGVIVLCATIGFSSGYYIEHEKTSELLSNMETEAENLSLLTSSFVSTYSDIHKSNPNIDVPAVMRANTYSRFNSMYQGQERMVTLMVGVPGKEISTPPTDPQLEQLIDEMSQSGPGNYQMISTVAIVENEKTHRSIYPSVASKESCVSCHNTIQNGEQHWKQGELMGAHVIDRGISAPLSKIRAYAALVGMLVTILTLSAVATFTLFVRLKKQSKNLHFLANRDPLTGCLNRRALLQKSGELHIHGCAAGGLLMMDLDHFKFINDTYGHDVGDQVLQHFVAIVNQIVRPDDIVARIGGEEFVVYLPGCTVAQSEEIARRICDTSAQSPYQFSEQSINVTVSIGLVQMINSPNNIFGEWLAAADRFLYKAKKSGRNQVWHSGPLIKKSV